MSEKIKIKCEGASTLHWNELTIIQGELKSLSVQNFEKMKKLIVEEGYTDPIKVWKGTGEYKNKYCILDGTQRHRVIGRMLEQGFLVPPLPIDWIDAENYNKAKEVLLSMASQYGRIEKEGLYNFLMDTNLTMEDIDDFNFPELRIDKFKIEYFEELKESQIDFITKKDKQYIIAIECNSEKEMKDTYSTVSGWGAECKLIT